LGGYKKVVESRIGNSSPAKSSNALSVTGKNTTGIEDRERETQKIKFCPYRTALCTDTVSYWFSAVPALLSPHHFLFCVFSSLYNPQHRDNTFL